MPGAPGAMPGAVGARLAPGAGVIPAAGGIPVAGVIAGGIPVAGVIMGATAGLVAEVVGTETAGDPVAGGGGGGGGLWAKEVSAMVREQAEAVSSVFIS